MNLSQCVCQEDTYTSGELHTARSAGLIQRVPSKPYRGMTGLKAFPRVSYSNQLCINRAASIPSNSSHRAHTCNDQVAVLVYSNAAAAATTAAPTIAPAVCRGCAAAVKYDACGPIIMLEDALAVVELPPAAAPQASNARSRRPGHCRRPHLIPPCRPRLINLSAPRAEDPGAFRSERMEAGRIHNFHRATRITITVYLLYCPRGCYHCIATAFAF